MMTKSTNPFDALCKTAQDAVLDSLNIDDQPIENDYVVELCYYAHMLCCERGHVKEEVEK